MQTVTPKHVTPADIRIVREVCLREHGDGDTLNLRHDEIRSLFDAVAETRTEFDGHASEESMNFPYQITSCYDVFIDGHESPTVRVFGSATTRGIWHVVAYATPHAVPEGGLPEDESVIVSKHANPDGQFEIRSIDFSEMVTLRHAIVTGLARAGMRPVGL